MLIIIGEGARYKTKVRGMIGIRGKEALRRKVDNEKHLEIYEGLIEGIGMSLYLHGPIGLREKIEAAISGKGPGPARKMKEIYD